MKLITFSVSNYRSITRAHKIQLHDLTILVGKNNEGKSNIIKAISLSMNIIKKNNINAIHKLSKYYSKYSADEIGYIWQRDFPINSQNKTSGSKNTKFELEFKLSPEELNEFNKSTLSSLSTYDFTIVIEIGPDNIPNLKVSKKGTSKLNKKSILVNEFVANNLVFNYIPAIRRESQAVDLIKETLSQELKIIENNSEYIEAINTINRLQQQPLNKIAEKVKNTLQIFIPTINSVKIDIEESLRKISLRRDVEVSIDDGVLTNVEHKGDGIKNLATLAMLTDRYNVEQSSIIAIDEPEAHLHPGSIRQLNDILIGLVKDNQVIIATHNQLFINKSDIKSNIIVSSGKALPAKNLKEIREILGVKLADNMVSCDCILFVEGKHDKKIIEALCLNNTSIRKALRNNEFNIEALGGASKLSAKLYETNNTIFDYYVFLDNDESGQKAYTDANSQKMLEPSKITFANCPGKSESEIEDLLKAEIYIGAINEEFNTRIKASDFDSMKKWSTQIKDSFLREGKPWNDEIEYKIKEIIAEQCCLKIHENIEVFRDGRKEPIESLIRNLEKLVEKK